MATYQLKMCIEFVASGGFPPNLPRLKLPSKRDDPGASRNLLGFRDYNVRINWRIQKEHGEIRLETIIHDIHSHHYPWMCSRRSAHLEVVVRLLRPMQGRVVGCGVLGKPPQQRAQHGRFPGGVLRCKHSMCFRGKGRSRKRSVRSWEVPQNYGKIVATKTVIPKVSHGMIIVCIYMDPWILLIF